MLRYTLTFLILALLAGLVGLSGTTGARVTIAWSGLVTLFVLTLAAAVGGALARIARFEHWRKSP